MTDTLRKETIPETIPHESLAGAPNPVRRGLLPFHLTTFDALQHRGYLYMWIGILFTSAGAWMEQVAISWLVYELTGSAFLLGAVNGMRALPFLFFGPVAGAIADRLHPKLLMLWSQYIILGLYVALVALLALDVLEVWHLFVFTFGASAAWSFNQPVRQALIPALVPREHLMNAVALQSVGFNLTRIIGPGVGGVLMATVGGGWTFFLVALTWVGVIGTTYLIPVTYDGSLGKRGTVWNDMIDGFVYLRTNTVVFGLLALALIPMLFAMPYMSLLPLFAGDVFHMDARGLGELLTATGVGAIASTLTVASLGKFRGKGGLLAISGIGIGLSILLFSLSSFYPLSLALLALVGMFQMAYLALTNTLLQLATPQEYLGRVMSIFMLDRGLMPLGSMVAGAIAEVLGAPFALAVMGGGCAALVAVGIVVMPAVRRLE